MILQKILGIIVGGGIIAIITIFAGLVWLYNIKWEPKGKPIKKGMKDE